MSDRIPLSEQPECQVAVLTPPGRGAVASVVVFGKSAVGRVESLFRGATDRSIRGPANRILYGRWRAGRRAQEDAGEELVVVRRDEQTVEVHCHGGSAAIERIVSSLTNADSIQVPAEVWLARQTSDQTVAEARLAVAQAETTRVASILLDQIHGRLSQAVHDAMKKIRSDDIDAAIHSIDDLLGRAPLGRHLTTPWRIAMVGPTNVGKSSLTNVLLGYQRALVCDTAGTTRDVLTDTTAIDGWPIELADTAGLRSSGADLEQQGMQLATQSAASADLVLLVTDLTQPWPDEYPKWLGQLERRHVLVHNKLDLVSSPPDDRPPGILTSARDSIGIDRLAASIAGELVPQPPAPGAAVPFLDRHTELLQGALASLHNGQYLHAGQQLAAILEPRSQGEDP